MKCDVIAEGVVAATKEVRLTSPTWTDPTAASSILTHRVIRARLVMTMLTNQVVRPTC